MKFLSICENINEMIKSLNEIFSQPNIQLEEKNGEYNMELKIRGFSAKKKCIIQ